MTSWEHWNRIMAACANWPAACCASMAVVAAAMRDFMLGNWIVSKQELGDGFNDTSGMNNRTSNEHTRGTKA